jgi:hypothetical protein
VRVTGTPVDHGKPTAVSLIFYTMVEGEGKIKAQNGFEIIGKSKSLGPFGIFVNEDLENKHFTNKGMPSTYFDGDFPDLEKPNIISMNVKKEVWRTGEIVKQAIMERSSVLMKKYPNPVPTVPHLFHLSDPGSDDPNLILFQHFLSGSFVVIIMFDCSTSMHLYLEMNLKKTSLKKKVLTVLLSS